MSQLLTIQETVGRLKFSRKTIYKFIRKGELKAIKIIFGGKSVYRVEESEIQKWIDSKTRLANPNTEFVIVKKWM